VSLSCSHSYRRNSLSQPSQYHAAPWSPASSGWAATDTALTRLIESTGRGEASVRYADPATGRDIMPTLRAELHRVLAGHRTATTRTAGSGIWVVYRGSGATLIGGRRFRWR
jgi:gentisate 1,2-dioxygenase